MALKTLGYNTNLWLAPGDRSHIPAASQPLYEIFNADIQRVASRAPAQYKPHVQDTEKRLSLLFDQLNEDALKPETLAGLSEVAQALQGRQYEQAQALFTDLMKSTNNEGSAYMVS